MLASTKQMMRMATQNYIHQVLWSFIKIRFINDGSNGNDDNDGKDNSNGGGTKM